MPMHHQNNSLPKLLAICRRICADQSTSSLVPRSQPPACWTQYITRAFAAQPGLAPRKYQRGDGAALELSLPSKHQQQSQVYQEAVTVAVSKEADTLLPKASYYSQTLRQQAASQSSKERSKSKTFSIVQERGSGARDVSQEIARRLNLLDLKRLRSAAVAVEQEEFRQISRTGSVQSAQQGLLDRKRPGSSAVSEKSQLLPQHQPSTQPGSAKFAPSNNASFPTSLTPSPVTQPALVPETVPHPSSTADGPRPRPAPFNRRSPASLNRAAAVDAPAPTAWQAHQLWVEERIVQPVGRWLGPRPDRADNGTEPQFSIAAGWHLVSVTAANWLLHSLRQQAQSLRQRAQALSQQAQAVRQRAQARAQALQQQQAQALQQQAQALPARARQWVVSIQQRAKARLQRQPTRPTETQQASPATQSHTQPQSLMADQQHSSSKESSVAAAKPAAQHSQPVHSVAAHAAPAEPAATAIQPDLQQSVSVVPALAISQQPAVNARTMPLQQQQQQQQQQDLSVVVSIGAPDVVDRPSRTTAFQRELAALWGGRVSAQVKDAFAQAPKFQGRARLGRPHLTLNTATTQQLAATLQGAPADSVPSLAALQALKEQASATRSRVSRLSGTLISPQPHAAIGNESLFQPASTVQQVVTAMESASSGWVGETQPANDVSFPSEPMDQPQSRQQARHATSALERKRHLMASIEEARQVVAQLQAERKAVASNASATIQYAAVSSDEPPSEQSPSPIISLDTPIFRLGAAMRRELRHIEKLQAELQSIASGTWTAPQFKRPAKPLEQRHTQQHKQLVDQPASAQTIMDEFLEMLQPARTATTTGSGSGSTANVFAVNNWHRQRPMDSWADAYHDTADRYYPPSGNEPLPFDMWDSIVPKRRPQLAPRTMPAPPPPANPEVVSSWVDELRGLLGGSQPTGSPGQRAETATVFDAQQENDQALMRSQHIEMDSPSGDLKPLEIPALVSVRVLAEMLGTSSSRLESWLREVLDEVPASDLDALSAEAAELAALEWGRTPIMTAWTTTQGEAVRPPVVTIMGHVDHGKTSLLDALRNSAVAANEAGGITQHIGAFEVVLPGSPLPITFLDTPGHAAFTAMRARGAAVTDIVVLVVAADDGIMPQTREALAHARSANCPLVVALTKCDLPGSQPAVVKQALLAEGVELEEYGGTVQLVHTSAKTGLGLQDLTEALQLQAELMELKAGHEGPARAVVVEASQGRMGPQATVIVQQGRLTVGDAAVVGTEFGKIRALRTSSGAAAPAEGVGPGHHALVLGLRGLPVPGDELKVVRGEEQAKRISNARASRKDDYRRSQLMASLHTQRSKEATKTAEAVAARRAAREARYLAAASRRSATAAHLEQLAAEHRAKEPVADAAATQSPGSGAGSGQTAVAETPPEVVDYEPVELRLVVKADVQGSVEAVHALLQQLSSQYVNIKVLHAGVGPLTLGDINLAVAAGAHLVAFNLGGGVRSGSGGAAVEAALQAARTLSGVTLLSHNVVYHLMDELQELVKGVTPYVEVEEVVGEATVQASFPMSNRKGVEGARIAGLRVTQGTLTRASSCVRVVRNGVVVHEGAITGLRRHKLDVDVVGSGTECGLVVDEGSYSDWQQGDVLQCVSRVRKRAEVPHEANQQYNRNG